MMYGMRRTTIYLTDELKRRVERAARARGSTEAEVVRAALEAFTDPGQAEPRVPLFASGDPTLAARADELLAAGFGDD